MSRSRDSCPSSPSSLSSSSLHSSSPAPSPPLVTPPSPGLPPYGASDVTLHGNVWQEKLPHECQADTNQPSTEDKDKPSPTSPRLSASAASRTSTACSDALDLFCSKVEHEPGHDGDDEPPDGGLQAWACIASAFLLLFCVFGLVTSMGQLQSYYATHQLAGYSRATAAWIATLQSTLTFLASVFFGRLFDAHGARALVRVGTTLSVASLVGLAFCTKYIHLLFAHALFGFAGSILWTPAAAVPGHWFARRRGTAIGIVGCGSGAGGVVYPLLLERLLARLPFRDAILVVAGLNAALMLPSWWLLRTRRAPRSPLPWRRLGDPWRDARFACLVVGSCLCMLNMFSPYFDAPVLAAANGLPAGLARYAVAILQAGSFLGRATSGLLADRLGVFRVFAAMGVLTALVLFAFWTAPVGDAPTVAGMVAYGYASGAWVTLMSAATVALSPGDEAGMRVGLLWTVVSVPILAGPVVCGVLVSAAGGRFTLAGIFCGVSYLVGTGITVVPAAVDKVRARRCHAGHGSEDAQA